MRALLQQELQYEIYFPSYGDKYFLTHPDSIVWPFCEQNFFKNLLISKYGADIYLITNDKNIPNISIINYFSTHSTAMLNSDV